MKQTNGVNGFESKEEEMAFGILKFEDLLDLVGTSGWRTILIFVMSSMCGTALALHTLSYQFLGATPNHWCHIPELTSANWTNAQIKEIAIPFSLNQKGEKEYSKCLVKNLNYEELSTRSPREILFDEQISAYNDSIYCNARQFEDHAETIVTKWDLVCDRRALYSTTQSAVMIGFLLGSIIGGYLNDKFGRTFIFKCTTILYIIFGYLTTFSQSIEVYIFMRVFTAMFNFATFLAGFVLALEMCSNKQRALVSNYFMLPWSFGFMLTAGIAYYVRPWKMLQIALVSPALFLLINFIVLPESPRWLIMNERYEEALKILAVIARSNGKTIPSDEKMIHQMKQIHDLNTPEKDSEKESPIKRIKNFCNYLFCMVIDPKLRMLTFGVFFCWMASAMVYYGVSLNSDVISVDEYLYLFLGGLIEFPAYLILWPATAFFGRKKSVIMFFFICAFSLVSVVILVVTAQAGNYYILKLILFLIGKFSITAGFHVMWVYTGELYPTNMRSLVVGQSSMMARIGSGCSPYINDLLGSVAIWAPSALFGGISLTAGLVAFIFTETASKDLPDSVEQIFTADDSQVKRKKDILTN